MTDEKTIIVKRKGSWGNEWIYPVCKNAKLFANISGKKTLLPRVIDCVKALGYQVKQPSEDI
jgi:hypothetical protein